jgi:hypothetical protein
VKVDDCLSALENGVCATVTKESASVIWFPMSNEFVLLGKAEPLLQKLSRLKAVASFPVDEADVERRRSDMLNSALAEGSVYGDIASSVSHFADGEECVGELVSSYDMELELSDESAGEVQVAFYSKAKKKAGSGNKGAALMRVEARLPWMDRGMSKAFGVAEEILASAKPKIESFGLSDLRQENGRLTATMGDTWVERESRHRLLDKHPRISVIIGNEVFVEQSCELEPQHEGIAKALAFDSAIKGFQDSEDPLLELDRLLMEGALSETEVRTRLWQIREFGALYRLREQEDFAE